MNRTRKALSPTAPAVLFPSLPAPLAADGGAAAPFLVGAVPFASLSAEVQGGLCRAGRLLATAARRLALLDAVSTSPLTSPPLREAAVVRKPPRHRTAAGSVIPAAPAAQTEQAVAC